MKMDVVAGSGNDEFYTPQYAINPLLPFVPKDKIIWCPFDTQHSLIYKSMVANGNVTIATHLEFGWDFFNSPIMGDVIISNPPYSKKQKCLRGFLKSENRLQCLLVLSGCLKVKKDLIYFQTMILKLCILTDVFHI